MAHEIKFSIRELNLLLDSLYVVDYNHKVEIETLHSRGQELGPEAVWRMGERDELKHLLRRLTKERDTAERNDLCKLGMV